mgnify:CR=1 FL=1
MGRGNDSQSLFWIVIAIITGLIFLIQSEYSYILMIALSLFLFYRFSVFISPDEPKINKQYKPNSNLGSIATKLESPKEIDNPIYGKSEIYFSDSSDVDDFLNYEGYIYGVSVIIKSYDIDKERINAIINKHSPINFHFVNCELTTIKFFGQITRFTVFEFINCNLTNLTNDIQQLLDNVNVFGLTIEQSKPLNNLGIIANYPHLTSITIKLRLEVFPSFIFKMKKLESLDLSDNFISEIPEKIGQFKKLKRLQLHGNKIKTLPKEIMYLNLNSLSINYQDLLEHDKEYFKEYFESIRYFDYEEENE